ncbi:MAG TPA: site-2 protease family protein [Polyangiaceae bacterium]|nr:site-2 protease family protein [Polyangiaceae bacterium]
MTPARAEPPPAADEPFHSAGEPTRAEPAGRPEARGPGGPMLPWSWKLATFAGVDVYVHGSFFFLVAFVVFGGLAAGRGLASAAQGILLLHAVFAMVVLHEFGHILMARRLGVRTRDITLLPIGGVARMDRLPEGPGQQLLVALAGPGVNATVALLLFGLMHLLGAPVGLEGGFGAGGSLLSQLLWINLSLAAFNLLPAYPMDGGRVLRALLAMRLPPERATQVAARVGQGAALVFGAAGLVGSPMLLLLAGFVWLGARAEYAASTTRLAIAGLSARHAMLTDFQTVSPVDFLSRAAELSLAGFQRDFPVVDGARPVGLLTRGDLREGLAEGGAGRTVRRAMRPDFETAGPGEALTGVLTRAQQSRGGVLLVVEGETLVGLLTANGIESLVGFMTDIRHGERSARANAPPAPDAGATFVKNRARFAAERERGRARAEPRGGPESLS